MVIKMTIAPSGRHICGPWRQPWVTSDTKKRAPLGATEILPFPIRYFGGLVLLPSGAKTFFVDADPGLTPWAIHMSPLRGSVRPCETGGQCTSEDDWMVRVRLVTAVTLFEGLSHLVAGSTGSRTHPWLYSLIPLGFNRKK